MLSYSGLESNCENILTDLVDMTKYLLLLSPQIYLQLYLQGLFCYGFLLSCQFWQVWAALPGIKEKVPPKIIFAGIRTSCFLFHRQIAQPFEVKDKSMYPKNSEFES